MQFNKLSKSGMKSGYSPLIWIQTLELERGVSYVLNSLNDAGQNLEDFSLGAAFTNSEIKKVYISAQRYLYGSVELKNLDSNNKQCSFNYLKDIKNEVNPDLNKYENVLLEIGNEEKKKSPHLFVEPMPLKNPMYSKILLDVMSFKGTGAPVFVVATFAPPEELAEYAYKISLDALTAKEIELYLNKYRTGDEKLQCVEALLGLTYIQMLQCLEYCSKSGNISVADIHKFKTENFDGSMLEISHPTMSLNDIGGYHAFKKYVATLPKFYTDEAKQLGIKKPKGFIAFGVPGCSKTVSASIIAATLKVPLVNINLSKIMQGLVGASEGNMERALNQVRELKQCVVLLDESEKVLGGFASSHQSDAGTLARVMSRLLTFLHENENSFTVFTSNDITKLPPELMRAGRLDTQWYFSIPNSEEAQEILSIYIKKYGLKFKSKADLEYLVNAIDRFTGAEIEQTVINLQRVLFVNDRKEVTQGLIEEAVMTIVPVAKSSSDSIAALEEHARKFAVYASEKKASLLEPVKKSSKSNYLTE